MTSTFGQQEGVPCPECGHGEEDHEFQEAWNDQTWGFQCQLCDCWLDEIEWPEGQSSEGAESDG